MPSRSVLGALITGMFGIPSDPRLIEVLGWLLYALPVLAVFLWPAALAATPNARRKLLAGVAAVLTAAALALVLLVPAEGIAPPGPSRTATRVDGGNVTVTFTPNGEPPSLTVGIPGDDAASAIPLKPAGTQSVDGVEAQVWQTQVETDPKITAATATLKQLADLTGGRLPIGLGTARTPGPFQARWTATTSYDVVTHGNSLISAQSDSNRVAVLSGGGISTAKTVSLGSIGDDWTTAPADDNAVVATIARSDQDRAERALWRSWLPILLAAAAAIAAVIAVRTGRSSLTSEERQHDNHDNGHDETARTDEINVA
jgi:high-affinity iron transporter